MKDINKKKLPFNFYIGIIFILLLAGLFVSLYLSFSHYKVYTDIGYKSFCAISKSINCDTVSQSQYAVFLGVPVAVWGLIGYFFYLYLFISFIDLKNNQIFFFPLLFLISSAFALISLVLGYISSFYISAYCLMCIAAWAINFFLLFYIFLIKQRFNLKIFSWDFKKDLRFLILYKKINLIFLFVFVFLFVALTVFFPHYWKYDIQAQADVPTGITKNGHPWIGADDPEIEITEFSDYLCFQCKKMHYYLRNYISQNPGKIKLIHRNYPMDHNYNPLVKSPYHSGSGKMALLAIYAGSQNKFIEMNDFLFSIGNKDFNLEMAEKATGIKSAELYNALRNKKVLLNLKKDIYDGLKLRIEATPAYVIEGEVYTGNIPESVFKKLNN
jgi:uncharacterized membrane protein/protein-disulfide isomerase